SALQRRPNADLASDLLHRLSRSHHRTHCRTRALSHVGRTSHRRTPHHRTALPQSTIAALRLSPDELRRLLAHPLPGLSAQLRMAPNPRTWPEDGARLRPAAALLLVYPHAGESYVPLTVRGSALRHHTGQVSLPGGRLDRPDESIEQAALREAQEEI